MDRRLLEHLLKKGVIDSTQLRAAHQRATQSGENLLDVILEQGMTRDVILARALGSFYKYKVVDIGRVNPKQDALDRASGSFCVEHSILPFAIDKQSGDLLVAVSDPARSHSVLDAFQRKTGQKLRIYIAPRDALKSAITTHYPNAGKRNAPRTLGLADLSHYEVSSMSQVPGLGDSHFDAGTLSRMGFNPTGSPASGASRASASNYTPNLIDRFFEDDDPPPRAPARGAQSSSRNQDAADIASLKRENEALRNHIHRLEMSLQLEINLVRKLAELLLEQGIIDQDSYLEKMGRLR